MGYVKRYSKEGCTVAKDVDFGKVKTVAKIPVPVMVISSFQKKVAAADKPFDVLIEVDSEANKARMVIKKLASGSVTIDWEDRSAPETQGDKGVAKVKASLAFMKGKNDGYLTKMNAIKAEVKDTKGDIKDIEAFVGMAQSGNLGTITRKDIEAMIWKIGNLRERATKIAARGADLKKEHDGWYLEGPRKGIAPILKQAGVDPSKLDKTDADAFAKALHDMSQDANKVKAVYDVDVRTATDAFVVRLTNLEALVKKSVQDALATAVQNLGPEVEKLRTYVGKALVETKLEKTKNLMDDLEKPSSSAYQRLKSQPQFLGAERESNKTRLENIPKFLEQVSKQVSRLKKTVPAAFQNDPAVLKQFQELDALEKLNNANMKMAETAIKEADVKLTQLQAEWGG